MSRLCSFGLVRKCRGKKELGFEQTERISLGVRKCREKKELDLNKEKELGF